jgi:hypothetical protein
MIPPQQVDLEDLSISGDSISKPRNQLDENNHFATSGADKSPIPTSVLIN